MYEGKKYYDIGKLLRRVNHVVQHGSTLRHARKTRGSLTTSQKSNGEHVIMVSSFLMISSKPRTKSLSKTKVETNKQNDEKKRERVNFGINWFLFLWEKKDVIC